MNPDASTDRPDRRIRIAHLYPDLLGLYGDAGNLQTLAVRSSARGIDVEVQRVLAGATRFPEADLYLIGGGQDREQVEVERELLRIGDRLARQVADGAAILAVCGGYQCLGIEYRTARGVVIHGPGILGVRTDASDERLVGPVVARLSMDVTPSARQTIVGFENHSGRTTLAGPGKALAVVEIGHGNNGVDDTEGVIEPPGAGGSRGLRIGTYLHGPLLPRNPHLADALLRAALRRTGQPTDLDALDDGEEWAAHDRFVEHCRRRPWTEQLPGPLRHLAEPITRSIGF